ncbi:MULTISPECIES: LysR family transcriptional regulator [Yersiniaceae]|jgi:DNA-binding transcriptional LysR family regulator|uniref:LysR family transcriptional regulator n=1 Tax=Yersiniaceae TaxID=1903411 RepID=UPI0005DE80D2|nr:MULTISPECIES: LysR family transcriptional regulator [Yersiniaceae]MCS3424532.1 DNA-binding transcriptional LysR family regulator [Rahnella sp. BIGb0603]CFQ45889.1 LysR family transcriptional regulator [Yersinia aleksiciae]
MSRIDLNSLSSFILVARERSFTRAAAQLGITQSALSHTIRRLEEKIDTRLLTRTTRGVSTTEAGERLFNKLQPVYEVIEEELKVLNELRKKPSGTIRISAHDHVANTVLWPKISPILVNYPALNVEISIAYGFIDIVAQRFDAGVRLGDQIAKDMVAVRISPEFRMVAVGAAEYFNTHNKPVTPYQLTHHNCINLRLETYGGLYAWEFEKEGQKLEVQVSGQLTFNTLPQLLAAVKEGHGLCFVPEDVIQADVDDGHLVKVLEDWSPTFPGYHLYYPSQRQLSAGFQVIVDCLRHSQ